MATADGLLRWYYATQEDAGAPALDFVDSRGLLYSPTCIVCEKSATRHWKQTEERWVCGSCGAPWYYEEKFLMKGEVDRPKRSDGSEIRLQKFVDLGVLLGSFLAAAELKWESRLYVANALGHSIRTLSFEASRAWNSPKWSKSTIGRMVQEGRAEWEKRLARAGIPFDPY